MANEKIDLSELRPVSVGDAMRARLRASVKFEPREAIALAVLGLLVVTGAALAYLRARPADASALEPVRPTPAATSSESAPQVVVHVVGAVKRPGVYHLNEGDRVLDAVRAAGGFAPGADTIAINLARPVVDGEQIVIGRKGEAVQGAGGTGAPSAGAATQGGKVNINLAGVSEFDSLPGIGPVLAQRIVDYRTQHGRFHSVKDLQKVSGIGPKKFASLEPYLTI